MNTVNVYKYPLVYVFIRYITEYKYTLYVVTYVLGFTSNKGKYFHKLNTH
nr:MAG TPA: hypothetical protein [Caudoviricetes sp.]